MFFFFFLSKIILSILVPLFIYVTFRINLSILFLKPTRILVEFPVESINWFRQKMHLNILSLPIHEYDLFFIHLLKFSLIFLSSALYVLILCLNISYFNGDRNDIFKSLIPSNPLLIYENTMYICLLTFYSETFLICLFISVGFL